MHKITFWFSLALIFVIPLENAAFIPGLGRISRLLGLLVAALWLAKVAVSGRMRQPGPIHFVIVLFVVWNALSVLWSIDIDNTVERFLTYFQLFGMIMLIWDIYITPAALRAGLQAYILGAYVSIGSTIYNYLHASEFYYRRYTGMGLHVNDLGLILALGIPVAWYLIHTKENDKKSFWLNLVNYAYIPAAVLAILLTASRGALLAVVPGFLYIVLSLSQLKPYLRVVLFSALIGALFLLQPFIPQSSLQRLAGMETEITQGDWNGRLAIWREGFIIFSKSPILGVGSGAFRTAATETGKVAHNFVLSLLAEIGIVGFALFALILAMVFHAAIRQPRWRCRLWLAVLMAWLIGAATHNWEHRKQTWLFLSLVVVSATLATPQVDSEVQEAIGQMQPTQSAQRKGG